MAVVPADGSEYSFLSRLPLVKDLGNTTVKRGVVGAVFEIGEQEAAFFCHHGRYESFGPRDLYEKKVTQDQAIANDKKYREEPMKAVIEFMEPYRKKKIPVFLMGDFNTASHLDYAPTIPWPITTMIQNAGYGDSWRTLFPDTKKKAPGEFKKTDPGITWSRVKTDDIYARMDFIFFAGPVKPIESVVVDLASSDHFSMYTIFQLD